MSSDRVVIDRRFELIEPLGKGGMGTVWRAYDVALHREVALKEVRNLDESATDPGIHRERVLREARALARIGHPNVVAVHHIVDSEEYDHPWIVMELVRGRALSEVLAGGSLPPRQVAELGRGLLGALRAAHSVGVLHRDVKPANVIVREDGSPVLTDFGIAAINGMTALTSTGSVVGSLDYVAPERLQGIEGDPRSDLWSLGLVLYYAVEGHQPMRRDSAVATLAAVISGQVPTPHRAGPLSGVLNAVLVADPAQRPDPARLDAMLAEAAGWGAGPGTGGQYFATPPATSGQHAIVPPAHSGQHPEAPAAYYGQNPIGPTANSGQHPDAPAAYYGQNPVGPTAHSGQHPVAPSAPYGQNPTGQHPIAQSGQTHTPPTPFATAWPGSSNQQLPSAWPDGVQQSGTGWARSAPPRSAPNSRRWGLLAAAGGIAAILALTAALVLRPDSTVSATDNPSTEIPVPTAAFPITTTPRAGTTTPGGATTAGPTANLHDPTNLRAALAALESATGGTEFTRTTVYPTFINTGAPVPSRPSVYDEFSYRDGRATRTGPGGDLSEPTVSLSIFNWDAVPELLRVAERDLGVPEPTARYLIIDPAWTFNDGRPTMLVYVSDDYGGGYLAADTTGTVIDKIPR
ncbi:serine/threonine-protein kinase [Nocardia lasii]|uniref:non-specific serine/threonine protein kinase n=1 Tax=Nocardia lasii TaxID=1616107 RepID=A0ABW1JYJ8_9NOCA